MNTEVLYEIGNWYKDNVMLANTAGIASSIFIFVLGYLNTKNKAKANTVTVDVKTVGDDMTARMRNNERLTETLIVEVAGLKSSIDKYADMLYMFANSTQISPKVKAELAKLYSSAKPKIEELKTKSIDVIEDVVDIVTDVKPIVENVYEQLVNSISKE